MHRRLNRIAQRALAALENMEIPAAARTYWAFTLPVQAPVPDVSARFENPIDRFLEKVRQDKGLNAAPRADSTHLAAPRVPGSDRIAAQPG